MLDCEAIARAIKVLLQPGGPYNSMPDGGFEAKRLKISGYRYGHKIA